MLSLQLRKRSLTTEFSLFGGLVIVLMFGLFLWFSWKTYSDLYTTINHSLESQASRVEHSFTDTINYTSYLMDYINTQIKEKGSNNLDYINTLLASFRLDPTVNNAIPWNMFSWVNADLKLIVNSDVGILDIPYDMKNRDYIPYTVTKPGVILLGKPTYGKISDKWIIPAGMGVTDKEGKYLGAMIFGFNVASFERKLEQSINIPGVYFAFIDEELQVIAESKNRYISEHTHLIKKLKARDFSNRESVILSNLSPFMEDDGFSFYLTLPKYRYALIIAYDKHLSTTTIRQAMSKHFTEFLIISLLIFILLYILKKRIISPIIALSSVADQISKGRDQIKIPESTSYEIHNLSLQLGSVIDYMEKLRGTQKSLEMSIQALEEEKDKAEAARATAEIAREEAHHAMMSKGQFLSKVVHEIQVPVNTVLDYADKQVKQLTANSINNEYMRYGKRIAESARFIMLLVGDLLERAKSESDTLRLDERPLHVHEIITYSMEMLHTRALKHGVEMTMNVPDTLPQLFADDLRMKQILNNILSNAVKYTPSGGNVRVTAFVDSHQCLHIEVIDTGLGILPDEIDKITEDFYRINRHKEKAEGTGLGLPLAKRLMELHGGNMHIRSTINIGTHVTLSFPNQRTMEANMPFFSQAI